jgi:acetyl-CoA acetyltransferase
MISGIGQSQTGRRLPRGGMELTLDACVAAIEDAALSREDIDGVASYPGPLMPFPGFSGAGVHDVIDALRLNVGWYTGAFESPSQLGSVINACLAINAGIVNHVLCFRSVFESSAQGDRSRAEVMVGRDELVVGRAPRVDVQDQWTHPFGAASPANVIALMAQRHFAEFGTTREQLGAIAVNGRRNARLNPKATLRAPMTLDDYLEARMISTPLCLYDCDIPVDGATAVIVSRADRVPDLRNPPIRIDSFGCALRGRPSWDQWEDFTSMAARDAAAMMWSRTTLTPDDVDTAQLYDGFSYLMLCWIEALGFCARGEGGAFVEGGKHIARDGELPLNTDGGQLSAGRLHGFGLLHEACAQLWGRAGEHQLDRTPQVAVSAAGGGPLAGVLLLVRE